MEKALHLASGAGGRGGTATGGASKCFGAGVAVALLMSAAPADADAAEGWYARIDAGYSIDETLDLGAGPTISGESSLSGGALGSTGVGYAFVSGWRIEGELSRRENDLENQLTLDQGGKIGATALMLNVYHDFNGEGRIAPYLGAGLGAARFSIEARNDAPLIPISIDDQTTTIAYQVLAGVGVSLSPSLDLDVGYRYFYGPSMEGHGSAPPLISFPFDATLSHHAVTVGLRWDF